MTNTQTTPDARTFSVCASTFGGYAVVERGSIDGVPYLVIVSALYGTRSEAQAEADRRTERLAS